MQAFSIKTGVHQPVFLLGATATGKTAVAVELLNRLPCEIISVDSALIYRQMNIGTAKPTLEEQKLAPHRLIDIIEPWELYSVSQFINDARTEIQAIQAKGKIPLLVGGTMMYFNALEYGLSKLPSANLETRQELELKAENVGWPQMHKALEKIDPLSAARIHPNDSQRIQRALEVWYSSGKSMSEWRNEARMSQGLQAIKFALFPEQRTELHKRICHRFELMLDNGFIKEVENLMSLPNMHAKLPSMRCVGYRQLWDYLSDTVSLEAGKDNAIAATRQLAKRQITWMRKMQNLNLYDSCKYSLKIIADKITARIEQSGNNN